MTTSTRARPQVSARLADVLAERRRRSWRRRGWGALALLLAGGLVWLFGFSSVLVVRSVEVAGVASEQQGAIRDLAAIPAGQPLARVDLEAARQRVATLPALAEVRVRRSWPSTVRIDVTERVPAVVVRNPDGSLQVADATGVLFASVAEAPADLPLLTVTTAAGGSAEGLAAGLSLVRALPAELAAEVQSITVVGPHEVTFRVRDVDVRWGGAEEPDKKVRVLLALLPTQPAAIDVSVPDRPVTRPVE